MTLPIVTALQFQALNLRKVPIHKIAQTPDKYNNIPRSKRRKSLIHDGYLIKCKIVRCEDGLGTGRRTNPRIRKMVNHPNTFVPRLVNSSFTYKSDDGSKKTCWMEVTNPKKSGDRWDAGHAVARMNGGPANEDNIFPQNHDCNTIDRPGFVRDTNVEGRSGRSWQAFEQKLNRKLIKYGEADIKIHLKP